MLWERLGQSLVENMSAGKGAVATSQGQGINRAGDGAIASRQERRIIRWGYGSK